MARILLIDDDKEVLDIYQGALAPRKHELVLASDGAQALEILSEARFDLVITDLAMPGLPGQALIQRMRLTQANAECPILVVSGLLDPAVMADLGVVGRIHFLAKPFRAQTLVDRVDAALAAHFRKTSPQMAEMVTRFTEAVQTVFSAMMGIELQAVSVEEKNPGEKCGDISSIVSVVGTRVKGSVSISFREKDFLAAVSKLLMIDFPAIDAENRDAIAELLNIIFGNARKKLNESGHDIVTAIPAIIIGPAHVLEHQSVYLPTSVIRFKSADVSLRLEVCLSSAS